MVNVEMLWWARWTASARVAPIASPGPPSAPAAGPARGPVVLATLHGAPIAPDAAGLAVAAAVDNALALVVVGIETRFVGGRTAGLQLPRPAAASADLRAPAERAAEAGIEATVLTVVAARPVRALAESVDRLAPALVVLGTDPERRPRVRALTARAHRRAARALERRATCLLWSPGPSPAARERPIPAHH